MLDSVSMMCKCARIILLTIIGLLVGYGPVAFAIDIPPPSSSVPMTAPLITTAYFPLLPFGADNNTPPQYLPVGSNHSLHEEHSHIKQAIIVIHDQSRDASSWLTLLQTLAGSHNDDTLILAPQFLLEADMMRFSHQLPEGGKMFARWSLNGLSSPWEDGGDSLSGGARKGVSSFTAIDLLLFYLSDRQRFPSLQHITFVGHGAGADFVQRYAAVGQGSDFLTGHAIPLRYVVTNPSSYLYFTAQRPQSNKRGFFPPDTITCPDYNNYKYGLTHLNNYARRLGANAIKLRYANRTILYLLGEKVAEHDTTLDDDCAAQLQGSNRMTRAENYALYLNMLFNDADHNQQTFVKVPHVGFDPSALFSSRCAMSALFGDGLCE